MKSLPISSLQSLRPTKKKRSWILRSKPVDRTADGIVFDSKAEMRFYLDTIKPATTSGKLLSWCMQPTYWLAGVKYRPDFLLDWGHVEVVEVKGKRAPDETIRRWKRAATQMKTTYGIDVRLERR